MDYEKLHNITLFENLVDEELERVLQLAFIKDYKRSLTLFFEGMQGGIMYVLIEGEIKLYKKNKAGDEIFLATISRGDYMGELSLIDDDQRSATAKISDNSRLLVITRKCFNDMLYKEPKIAAKILLNIIKKTSQRLKTMNTKIIKLEEKYEEKE
jgi:CRP-like cAMP-binding protein